MARQQRTGATIAGASEDLDPEAISHVPQEKLKKLKAALEKGDLTAAAKNAQEMLDDAEKISLHIAITGVTGSGKSSFLNAMRGLDDGDEGAADIGVLETTSKPAPFPHPQDPNITFWDLPGIGTPAFPEDTYLQQVEFGRYDFFIIISSTRFTDKDIKLALEIQSLGKSFYFVRSKVDQDLDNERRLYNESGFLKKPSASR
ncbi:interferon-inducible GTPase 5-like [Alligator sinensis]|uniref:Interferon-inducible GTPase 5-like n=1 Tax=Alligator sinensis TaxID=38654 RepID=A0A3Q0FXI6_ALLSI|nr:interferon-inducible GTPase 5-like [Alligator sinensis]